MSYPLYRFFASVVILGLLLLGTAFAFAAQPDYSAYTSAQTDSTPPLAPVFQTGTAAAGNRPTPTLPSFLLTATAISAEIDTITNPNSIDIAELANFDADYELVIAELQENGVIPLGGNIIYETNYAFFDGTGGFYTPLAEYRPHTNYIMSGELQFKASEDPKDIEYCGFITRVQTEGFYATAYMITGFDGEGSPLLLDRTGSSATSVVDFTFDTYDLEEAHYYTIIVQDNSVLIFIDGELAIENDELEPRQGSYGIAIDSDGYGARCAVNNVWIYELDNVWDDDEGVCGVTTKQAINLRGGPGTNYELRGQIAPDDILSVDGQFLAPDGFIWWRLTTESWVRSDLVTEIGACEELAPEVKPED